MGPGALANDAIEKYPQNYYILQVLDNRNAKKLQTTSFNLEDFKTRATCKLKSHVTSR